MDSRSIRERLSCLSRREKIYLICRIALLVLLAVLFFMHPTWYSKVKGSHVFLAKKRLVAYIVAGLFFLLLPLFKCRQWEGMKRLFWILVCLGGILFALIMGEHVMKFTVLEMDPFLLFNNVILLTGFSLLFFAVTGKIKISLLLNYILVVGFGIMNYFIYKFRGEPINAADIYVAGTALNVAADYSFDINIYMFRGLFAGFCFLSVLMWLPDDVPYLKKKMRRLAVCLPALAIALTIGYYYALSDVPARQNIKVKVFNPYKSYKKNGEALNFVRSFYYMQLDKPVEYTYGNAARMMEESGYKSDAPAADPSKQPNIIVMMNESLTDFTVYDSVELSEDPLAYIHSLKGNPQAITGYVNADVFGGRTANTEYEFQTGNSVAFMPSYAVPYALYVRRPQPSITWNMIDMGYSGNDAFHAYKANGYSRPRAYPNLGFEEFISLETIKPQVTEADYLRNKVSDEANNRWVCQLYEEERKVSDAPFYIFNVTIANHGGYTADYDNFIQDIEVSGKFASDDSFKRFVNLCDYTDEAFEKMTEYFSKVDEPTILVMFGDHRPNLHNGFYKKLYGCNPSELDEVRMFQHYQTPLVIWANYEINPDGKYDEEMSDISINYLSAAVTQIAGLPQTAYQKFLNDMRQVIPVFTAHKYKDKQGNIYSREDEESPYFDLVNEYHTYEYNYQFDEKHRQEDFFCLDTPDRALDRAQEAR